MKTKSDKESGQILLIIILISTVLLTVGLSLSQISVEEGRIAKLEEEKKKAFAAAEAGLDAAIKLAPGQSFNITTLGLPDISAGSATVSTAQSTKFTTPILAKDEQYSLYMANYVPNPTPGAPPTFDTYIQRDLNFYLGSGNPPPGCPPSNPSIGALELTFIDSSDQATRHLIDPCTRIGGADINTTSGSFTFDGNSYVYKTNDPDLNALNNIKLIIIRSFFDDTKVGVEGTANLPIQGKTIVSTAKTTAGSSEKIELFQSYPQIPANFYVPSF